MVRPPDARKAASRVINRPTGMTTASLLSRQSLEDAVRDRVVLVTGASSGIGEASALRIGPNAHAAACDLSEIEELERMATARSRR